MAVLGSMSLKVLSPAVADHSCTKLVYYERATSTRTKDFTLPCSKDTAGPEEDKMNDMAKIYMIYRVL